MGRNPATAEQEAFGKAIGSVLAERRALQKVTASQLAGRSGVSVDTVRALEGGRIAQPGFQTVQALASELGLGLDALVVLVVRRTRQMRSVRGADGKASTTARQTANAKSRRRARR